MITSIRLFALCCLIAVLPSVSVQAGIIFRVNDQKGSESLDTWVRVEQAAGDLKFTMQVDDSVTGNIGDLRGIFFHVADESSAFLDSLSAYGVDIVGIQKFEKDGVDKLSGGGPNIIPLGPFDAGIEIGTNGMGGDDIQYTEFFLTSAAGPLDLNTFFGTSNATKDNFVMGIRGQSVGPFGTGRGGSSKTGSPGGVPDDGSFLFEPPTPTVPEPGSAFIWLAGMTICVVGRRRVAKV